MAFKRSSVRSRSAPPSKINGLAGFRLTRFVLMRTVRFQAAQKELRVAGCPAASPSLPASGFGAETVHAFFEKASIE